MALMFRAEHASYRPSPNRIETGWPPSAIGVIGVNLPGPEWHELSGVLESTS
jgi:hypothetical protein